jgi:hypothetical protein
MRTNERSLPALASALLLAASAATVSGCCTAPADSHRPPITVKAFVTYDGTKTELTHFPSRRDKKLAQLSESKKDTICWCSPHGQVHIVSWGRKSPFDRDPVYEGECLQSRPPKHGSHVITDEGKCKDDDNKDAECYEYKIELWLDATGTKRVPIDPRIVVMP